MLPATHQDITADRTIDIRAETCPMTFVRTRLALDRMQAGEVLLVHLQGQEPLQNIPRTAQEQGHEILALREQADGTVRLWLRKGGLRPG